MCEVIAKTPSLWDHSKKFSDLKTLKLKFYLCSKEEVQSE